ncbi:rhodanese-related sulfurtransferase [Bacillus oleivorans]|uniref:Rhodanese-related sulfurtransferase n=1 Tax=Bacillus oleivorans TaxID=1448271 RepID=A0A285D5N5_9BACI|nr:rhodanese-related sulfurtransferase [Bacillus oleivorans]
MEYTVIGVVVILVALRFMPSKGVKQITTEELKNVLTDKNKQFIDVRTQGEYKANHIREFENIPLNQLPQKTESLSKEKEVVVICQSGMRSSQASKQLKKSGFKSVTNVRGGMSAWRS